MEVDTTQGKQLSLEAQLRQLGMIMESMELICKGMDQQQDLEQLEGWEISTLVNEYRVIYFFVEGLRILVGIQVYSHSTSISLQVMRFVISVFAARDNISQSFHIKIFSLFTTGGIFI